MGKFKRTTFIIYLKFYNLSLLCKFTFIIFFWLCRDDIETILSKKIYFMDMPLEISYLYRENDQGFIIIVHYSLILILPNLCIWYLLIQTLVNIFTDQRSMDLEKFNTVQKYITLEESFEQQMETFLNVVSLTDKDIKTFYDPICQDLKTVIQQVYHKCKIFTFGSTAMGLGLKTSDLDVLLNIGTKF